MADTLTTYDPFLKEKYDDNEVLKLICEDRPFLSKIKKTKGSGDTWVVPVIVGNPQGLGATVATAQTGAAIAVHGSLKGKKWNITWGDYSAHVEINDKVLQASRDNVGAFFENQTAEIDGLYRSFADQMATYAFGDAGHSFGTFTESSGTCTMVTPSQIVNVQLGMQVQVSDRDGTTATDALLGSGSIGYVISVNQNAGTFVVSTTSTGTTGGTPSSWTGTMYGYRYGDFGGTATPNLIYTGLSGWIPQSDPGATAFYGVTRTTAIQALSGTRLTAAEIVGQNIERRAKLLANRISARGTGQPPTDAYFNPEDWQVLADVLESRGQRTLGVELAGFNYETLQLRAAGKVITCWADRYCPKSYAYMVNHNVIEIKTLSGFPSVVNGDGMTMLRKTATNDYEYRLVSYPGFAVRGPGYGNGTVPV